MPDKNASIAKITRPNISGIIPRRRLFKLLDSNRKSPITWVSGPAGSGKTTLVASYLDARRLSCLWYQIDEGDADISTFFYYMGLAAKKAAPRNRKPLPLLTPEYLGGIPVFTGRYFEDLYSRLRSPFVIVFDNHQDVLSNSGFHEMLTLGLNAIPEGIGVIVISRNEPPPAFARLRANSRMGFLGWDEIRLTLEESKEIVKMKGGILSAEALRHAHKKINGWAAGLMLIIEGAKTKNIDCRTLEGLTTDEIFDYFASEIFEKADKKAQIFLLKTAFLSKVTPQIADKLTGIGNAAKILSRLNKNHYFTERHSLAEPAYQYHPLFREFLLSRAEELFTRKDIVLLQQSAAALLEESGQIEDAAALFHDAKHWEGLCRLITGKAQSLISGGRNKTLEEWIGGVPGDIMERTPWLLYWLGICRLPFAPGESRKLFEKTFQLFRKQKEDAGTFMAWSGAVDTFMYEWNDFSPLDAWIEWLDEHMRRNPSFPSIEVEARVSSSMAGALLWRQPYHPDIRQWVEKALNDTRKFGDVGLGLQACIYAAHYYILTGDITYSLSINEEIKKMTLMPAVSPLALITCKWLEAAICNWAAASHESALRAVSEALDIANNHGIHIWDHMILALGLYGAILKGDDKTASEFLGRMESTLRTDRRHGYCHYHHLASWYEIVFGEPSSAFSHAEIALKFAVDTGIYFPEAFCRLALVNILCEKKDYRQALDQLDRAHELVSKSKSRILEYMYRIAKARLALDMGNDTEGLEFLRDAMLFGQRHNFINMLWWWQPPVMTYLCTRALEAGIEVEYVQELIRKRNLVPDNPPIEVENWPWPLKIYTLGKFEIVKDGEPVGFSGKVQKKPMEMLKALISFGGKQVGEGRINDVLWPEADGDAAHSAFKTTLSRLRQLLGNEKAIKFQDGRTGLDPRSCWLDVWALERIYEMADSQQPAEKVVQLAENAIAMYKGHFLQADNEYVWAASSRERLKNKVLHLITKAGNCLQQAGQWQEAVQYYQMALDIDELEEELYRRLMICYQKLGHKADAVRTYRRCRSALFSNLGVGPSPKTEAVYNAVMQYQ